MVEEVACSTLVQQFVDFETRDQSLRTGILIHEYYLFSAGLDSEFSISGSEVFDNGRRAWNLGPKKGGYVQFASG